MLVSISERDMGNPYRKFRFLHVDIFALRSCLVFPVWIKTSNKTIVESNTAKCEIHPPIPNTSMVCHPQWAMIVIICNLVIHVDKLGLRASCVYFVGSACKTCLCVVASKNLNGRSLKF